jgi:nucleoside-diphosphate-sugar epimerase
VTKKLFIFGLGYSARAFANQMQAAGWQVTGTTRSAEKADELARNGFHPMIYAGGAPEDISAALCDADAILISIAPDPAAAEADPGFGGDPVLRDFSAVLEDLPKKPWLGYLSTVGVYGNHDGAWVDETTLCRPVSRRSKARMAAETAWQQAAAAAGLTLGIFRLSGIYGPGRNPLEKVARGEGRRINKPGQVFNRIHVDDIAAALALAVARNKGGIYNITDDEPAPPQDVVALAAELLSVEVPPLIPFDDADLSPMGRSFYGENKRVSNEKSKTELGLTYTVPNYRTGMQRALETWQAGR